MTFSTLANSGKKLTPKAVDKIYYHFRLEGEFYVFDSCSVENRGCNQIELQRDFSGSFFSSSTVVWDRQSSMGIRMPRPLKEVTCKVIINSVEQAIFPSVLVIQFALRIPFQPFSESDECGRQTSGCKDDFVEN